jgi:hypothetical protein
MNIDEQKVIADKMLEILEYADPACILAGGAPRNWHLGELARDLDFYVNLNEDSKTTRKRWAKLGLDLVAFKSGHHDSAMYSCMENLNAVYEGEFMGMPIQVMVMRGPTFKTVLPHMGTSVCKFWYKDKVIHAHEDALFSIQTRTIYKKDDYTAKVAHLQKMNKYFPSYRVRDIKDMREDKLRYIIEKELGGVTDIKHYLEKHL